LVHLARGAGAQSLLPAAIGPLMYAAAIDVGDSTNVAMSRLNRQD
jgi:hypothetical protein